MDCRERVSRVLEFKEVDRFPRQVYALAGVNTFRKAELDKLIEKYPMDVTYPDIKYVKGKREVGTQGQLGSYIDAWGCVWYTGEPGVAGEVKEFPLNSWDDLESYSLPWEILDETDFAEVDRFCEKTDRFVLASSQVRPFERMQFLRGTENLLMDLAYGEKGLYKLRDMLHEFFIKTLEKWVKTDVDGISFMDDWGSQISLLISPGLWREFFKPLYKDYCEIIRKNGKYAFFHSDGNIESIYPDLMELGINAINSQLFCMDIETLGEKYGGKVVFWGEIDRQHILPFGTTDDVRKAVDRAAVALLKKGRTGVIAQCEWGNKDPFENIDAVFNQWDKY